MSRSYVRDMTREAAVLVALAVVAAMPPAGTSLAASGPAVDLPVLRAWSGDYPVACLRLLPERQRRTRVGYLSDEQAFARVWRAFKPGEEVPGVDFGRNLIVFSRNIDFYNRTSILKIRLKDGVAEILAIETLSAIPIGEKVAMAMAEVPREGIRFLDASPERIPVAEGGPASSPLDAAYMIEGRWISLRDGRHEEPAAPGSAAKAVVRVSGRPAFGDLDGDGDEDAALILAHAPGGSGTFYYAAAAINEGGRYRGTNAVLLGDRISPETTAIRDGVVFIEYADRRPGDPMAQAPSVAGRKVMVLRGGLLTESGPPGGGDRR